MSAALAAWRWSWVFLWVRPASTLLNLAMLSVAMAVMVILGLAQQRMDAGIQRAAAGVDAVVGAKGSPLQLVLSAVMHVDVPTGNIAMEALDVLKKDARVAEAIPLSLGDSHAGFRIVGTTRAYPRLYGAQLAFGQWWVVPSDGESPQVVIGAMVAKRTGLSPGQRFAGSHGLAGGALHEGLPYAVSGVMQACGCVVDRLVLTSTEAVWRIHDHEQGIEPEDVPHVEREVTSVLVRYSSPLAAVSFVRSVNQSTPWQAASPALEVTRLLQLLGLGLDAVRALAAWLWAMAVLSVAVAQWMAVAQRAPELALLRMLGCRPWRIALLLVCENMLLGLGAVLMGGLLAFGVMGLIGLWLPFSPVDPQDAGQRGAWVMAVLPALVWMALLIGVGSVLPVWRAHRLSVMEQLQSR